MPVSALHHRNSTGNHYKFHHKKRNNTTPLKSRYASTPPLSEEIRKTASQITLITNSREGINRSLSSYSAIRPGKVASLMLLLSQIRLADSPRALSDSGVTIPTTTAPLANPEDSGQAEKGHNGLNAYWNALPSIANTLDNIDRFIIKNDPLKFPGANSLPLQEQGETSGLARLLDNRIRHKEAPSRLAVHIKRANDKVIEKLEKKNFLRGKKYNKEKMLAAVAGYLADKNSITSYEERTKIIARAILAGNNLYGGKKRESISSVQAESVVRQWFFNNILGKSPAEYIAHKLKAGTNRAHYTVNTLHQMLSIDKLLTGRYLHYNNLPPSYRDELNTRWQACLLEEMPFLKFKETSVRNIDIKSYEFAHLYAGLRFLAMASMTSYTTEEAIKTGEKNVGNRCQRRDYGR